MAYLITTNNSTGTRVFYATNNTIISSTEMHEKEKINPFIGAATIGKDFDLGSEETGPIFPGWRPVYLQIDCTQNADMRAVSRKIATPGDVLIILDRNQEKRDPRRGFALLPGVVSKVEKLDDIRLVRFD